VAGFHVPPLTDSRTLYARALKPLLEPGRHKLIGCMHRQQGLLVARGNPLQLRNMGDVATQGARFVQRQQGSGTRLLVDHLLAEQGLDAGDLAAADAPTEDSHVAVAAAVASGLGDCALGIAAAAEDFGLDFVPLVEEEYFLVCLTPTLEQPAVQTLRRRLRNARWAELLATLPGYRAASAGQVLSLTRALPWWHFRAPKPARAPRT
jgi:putative molybdopterin biosynthesis protein